MTLEDIVKKSSGGIYNNAAQIWNHTFFWNCMSTPGGGELHGRAGRSHQRQWGSYAAFKEPSEERRGQLSARAGPGWSRSRRQSVDIVNTGAAGTPLTTADKALLTVDVWEHAYHRLPQPAPQVCRDLPGQAGQLEVCRGQLCRLT